jgi:hypothetical protein
MTVLRETFSRFAIARVDGIGEPTGNCPESMAETSISRIWVWSVVISIRSTWKSELRMGARHVSLKEAKRFGPMIRTIWLYNETKLPFKIKPWNQ